MATVDATDRCGLHPCELDGVCPCSCVQDRGYGRGKKGKRLLCDACRREHGDRRVLMGINGLLGSDEGGGALQRGDLGLRQHGSERLAALCAEPVVSKTASTEIDAC